MTAEQIGIIISLIDSIENAAIYGTYALYFIAGLLFIFLAFYFLKR